jgi:hypothetical protein
VSERAHDPQVAADEEIGETVARLQFAQEFDRSRRPAAPNSPPS